MIASRSWGSVCLDFFAGTRRTIVGPVTLCYYLYSVLMHRRAVAQFGSALDWGSRGRGFKSRRPDQIAMIPRSKALELFVVPGPLIPICISFVLRSFFTFPFIRQL